ncbi:hypothetical protein [Deinococcus aluminii]|uniref:Uncharacterized protein n=1 Tax=Deinococcus aluminii TaxID=1656885 RepID=A0ABP9XG25_9DEIO
MPITFREWLREQAKLHGHLGHLCDCLLEDLEDGDADVEDLLTNNPFQETGSGLDELEDWDARDAIRAAYARLS